MITIFITSLSLTLSIVSASNITYDATFPSVPFIYGVTQMFQFSQKQVYFANNSWWTIELPSSPTYPFGFPPKCVTPLAVHIKEQPYLYCVDNTNSIISKLDPTFKVVKNFTVEGVATPIQITVVDDYIVFERNCNMTIFYMGDDTFLASGIYEGTAWPPCSPNFVSTYDTFYVSFIHEAINCIQLDSYNYTSQLWNLEFILNCPHANCENLNWAPYMLNSSTVVLISTPPSPSNSVWNSVSVQAGTKNGGNEVFLTGTYLSNLVKYNDTHVAILESPDQASLQLSFYYVNTSYSLTFGGSLGLDCITGAPLNVPSGMANLTIFSGNNTLLVSIGSFDSQVSIFIDIPTTTVYNVLQIGYNGLYPPLYLNNGTMIWLTCYGYSFFNPDGSTGFVVSPANSYYFEPVQGDYVLGFYGLGNGPSNCLITAFQLSTSTIQSIVLDSCPDASLTNNTFVTLYSAIISGALNQQSSYSLAYGIVSGSGRLIGHSIKEGMIYPKPCIQSNPGSPSYKMILLQDIDNDTLSVVRQLGKTSPNQLELDVYTCENSQFDGNYSLTNYGTFAKINEQYFVFTDSFSSNTETTINVFEVSSAKIIFNMNIPENSVSEIVPLMVDMDAPSKMTAFAVTAYNNTVRVYDYTGNYVNISSRSATNMFQMGGNTFSLSSPWIGVNYFEIVEVGDTDLPSGNSFLWILIVLVCVVAIGVIYYRWRVNKRQKLRDYEETFVKKADILNHSNLVV